MELLYKPDWEKIKQRMTAWWVHEDIGRYAIFVIAEKSDIKKVQQPGLEAMFGLRGVSIFQCVIFHI